MRTVYPDQPFLKNGIGNGNKNDTNTCIKNGITRKVSFSLPFFQYHSYYHYLVTIKKFGSHKKFPRRDLNPGLTGESRVS